MRCKVCRVIWSRSMNTSYIHTFSVMFSLSVWCAHACAHHIISSDICLGIWMCICVIFFRHFRKTLKYNRYNNKRMDATSSIDDRSIQIFFVHEKRRIESWWFSLWMFVYIWKILWHILIISDYYDKIEEHEKSSTNHYVRRTKHTWIGQLA